MGARQQKCLQFNSCYGEKDICHTSCDPSALGFWGNKQEGGFTAILILKTEGPSRLFTMLQFSSVQSLSHVRLFATPRITARQASLFITNSRSSLRLMSIESVMPSSHLILCRPRLLLPPVPPIYHGRMQHKNIGNSCEEELWGENWFDQSGRARHLTWRRRCPCVLFHLIVTQTVLSTKRANLLARCHPVCKAGSGEVAFFSSFFFNKV